jgi:hypothetical protein
LSIICTSFWSVFEEENFTFNTQNTQAAQYQRKVEERASPLNQAIMLFFACLCVLGAYFIPRYLNPPQKEKVVYFEDITEARMRLIPAKDRDAFINKLPSRGNSGQ